MPAKIDPPGPGKDRQAFRIMLGMIASEHGDYASIAARLGVDRGTLARWRNEFEWIQSAIDAGRAAVLRSTDAAMIEQARRGDPAAAKLIYSRFADPEKPEDEDMSAAEFAEAIHAFLTDDAFEHVPEDEYEHPALPAPPEKPE